MDPDQDDVVPVIRAPVEIPSPPAGKSDDPALKQRSVTFKDEEEDNSESRPLSSSACQFFIFKLLYGIAMTPVFVTVIYLFVSLKLYPSQSLDIWEFLRLIPLFLILSFACLFMFVGQIVLCSLRGLRRFSWLWPSTILAIACVSLIWLRTFLNTADGLLTAAFLCSSIAMGWTISALFTLQPQPGYSRVVFVLAVLSLPAFVATSIFDTLYMLSIVDGENNITKNTVRIVCAVLCSVHAVSAVAAIFALFWYLLRSRGHFLSFFVLVQVQLLAVAANVVVLAAIDAAQSTKKLSIGAAVSGTLALGGIAGVLVSFTFRRPPAQSGE